MSKLRAKRVIIEMVGNGGKSMSQAMIAVGYSPAYAHNPKKLLNTKAWKELVEERLPDDLITLRHNELLNADEIQHYIFPKLADKIEAEGKGKKKTVAITKQELSNEEIKMIVESVAGCRLIYIRRDFMGAWAFYSAPDNKSRKDALDMIYKLKGRYAPEQFELIKRKYQNLSNAELMEKLQKLKDFLNNK